MWAKNTRFPNSNSILEEHSSRYNILNCTPFLTVRFLHYSQSKKFCPVDITLFINIELGIVWNFQLEALTSKVPQPKTSPKVLIFAKGGPGSLLVLQPKLYALKLVTLHIYYTSGNAKHDSNFLFSPPLSQKPNRTRKGILCSIYRIL